MAATDLFGYVGAAPGIAGMITGVTVAVFGYTGYRRSVKIKALDMRLQLRKDLTAQRPLVDALPALVIVIVAAIVTAVMD